MYWRAIMWNQHSSDYLLKLSYSLFTVKLIDYIFLKIHWCFFLLFFLTSDLSFEKDFNRYLLLFFLSTLFTAVSCHSSHAGFFSGWTLKSKCSSSPWPLESSTSSFSAPRVCFLRPMHILFFHPAGTAAGGHSGKAIGGETPDHHYTIYCRWQKNTLFILFWGCFCKLNVLLLQWRCIHPAVNRVGQASKSDELHLHHAFPGHYVHHCIAGNELFSTQNLIWASDFNNDFLLIYILQFKVAFILFCSHLFCIVASLEEWILFSAGLPVEI